MKHSILLFLVALLLAGCGPHDPTSAAGLAQCYEAEFGSPPPAKISVVHARLMSIRDWGAQWLQLELREDALHSVVLPRGFKPVQSPPREFTTRDRYTPEWWLPLPASAFDYFENPTWTKGSWSSSRAVLAVDRVTGVAFFRCDRAD